MYRSYLQNDDSITEEIRKKFRRNKFGKIGKRGTVNDIINRAVHFFVIDIIF